MANGMSENAFTVGNAFTAGVYRDVYPAIDPTNVALSQAGKIVMITGASRGIGRDGIAWAFAKTSPKAIIVTARKVSTLKETETLIKKTNPAVEVLPLAMEISDESSVAKAFEDVKAKYGHIDVLVNNAGIFDTWGLNLSSTDAAQTKTWWREFEVNIGGMTRVARHFLNAVGTERPAKLLFMTSGAAFAVIPGNSAYAITKLAAVQVVAHAAAEHSNVTAIALHPGIVKTDMAVPFFEPFAKDTPQLAGAALTWLATDQASFMSGRYTTANWDVTELLARKDEIVEKNLLTVGLTGLDGRTAELRG